MLDGGGPRCQLIPPKQDQRALSGIVRFLQAQAGDTVGIVLVLPTSTHRHYITCARWGDLVWCSGIGSLGNCPRKTQLVCAVPCGLLGLPIIWAEDVRNVLEQERIYIGHMRRHRTITCTSRVSLLKVNRS